MPPPRLILPKQQPRHSAQALGRVRDIHDLDGAGGMELAQVPHQRRAVDDRHHPTRLVQPAADGLRVKPLPKLVHGFDLPHIIGRGGLGTAPGMSRVIADTIGVASFAINLVEGAAPEFPDLLELGDKFFRHETEVTRWREHGVLLSERYCYTQRWAKKRKPPSNTSKFVALPVGRKHLTPLP